jgi:hypothetical protein
MFCVSSASAGDHQSRPHFYGQHATRQSTNRGSPKVTKNLSMAGFEVITHGRF